ncbi:unnamed protein product [Enterobius vermicularis]|uniref:CFAP91 domain-containing protein n=1 Tax=Enterobius vermicularis TaxID=51028 RepID=A0A0N4V8P3_ENTVE|nr:unnamed protein product [Enterobius vermicularis]
MITGTLCSDLQDESDNLLNNTDEICLRQYEPVFIRTSLSNWNKYVNYKKGVCRKDCVYPRRIDKGFSDWERLRVDEEIRRLLSVERNIVEGPEERGRYVDQLLLEMALREEAEKQIKVDEEYEKLLKSIDNRQYNMKIEDTIINALVLCSYKEVNLM